MQKKQEEKPKEASKGLGLRLGSLLICLTAMATQVAQASASLQGPRFGLGMVYQAQEVVASLGMRDTWPTCLL